jgi:PAS domain S-box-containing protein
MTKRDDAADRGLLSDRSVDHHELLETLGAGVVVHAADTRILYANPSARRALGLSLDELTGKMTHDPAWRFLREDGRDMPLEAFPANRVLSTGASLKDYMVGVIQPTDDHVVWLLCNAFSTLDEAGALATVVVSFVDISARVEVEREARQLKAAFQASMAALSTADRDGRIENVNAAFLKQWGFKGREEVLGTPWRDRFVNVEDADRVQEALEARGRWMGEFLARREDGSTYVSRAFTTTLEDARGEVIGLQTAGMDVTDEHAMLRELEKSEERFRAVFNGVTDGILLADQESRRFVMANDTICQMLGYSREELLALGVDDIHPKADIGRIHEAFERQARGDQLLAPDLPVLRKDGSIFAADVTSTPAILDERPLLMGCFRDVTEQRETEAQFARAQRMESIGRLAGGLAHDFNNLLTVVLTSAEFMSDELPEGAAEREDVEQILAAAKKASTLTRKLLTFSRRQVVRPASLDLNQVISGVMPLFGRLLGEHIEIECDLAEDLGAIRADAGQMEQVILNLAVNARDAMKEGGTLTFETRDVELDDAYEASFVSGRSGPHVVLTVSDTGCGMAAETRARAFEPFYTTKPTGQGTGLGLSTVYGTVKQSGGDAWIFSEPMRGTTVKIFLPRVDEAPAVVPTQVELPAVVPAEGEVVLVVEDEAAVRRACARILEQVGYHVVVAQDGLMAEAIARSYPRRVDLLVTDVVMPGRSGWKTAEVIKGLFPHVRVLFMSGYLGDDSIQYKTLEPGIPFLEKPFSPAALIAKAREVLGA